MPNKQNIESPIILVGFGRSGTTLISRIIEPHPDIRFVGETTNLIFGTWQAVKASSGVTPPLFDGDIWVGNEERAGRVVRQAFLTCFPDNRSHWFQKPIGIPRGLPGWENDDQWSDAASWYWEVMENTFPKAKYFTMLRHPCDVVLSAKSYWGYDEAVLWRSLGFMGYLLTHPASPVKYAIHFEKLIQNKEQIVKDLFGFLELPFYKQALDAFSRVHVPTKGREKPDRNLATRSNEWDQLDPMNTNQFYIKWIENSFNKFGHNLFLPERFNKDDSIIENTDTSITLVSDERKQPKQELKREIARLEQQINRLHQDCAAKIQAEKMRFFNNNTKLQKLITKLEAENDRLKGRSKRKNQKTVWQLFHKSSNVREKIIAKVRYIYRVFVPYKIRIAFRILRHPEEKELYPQIADKSKNPGPILFNTEIADKSRYRRPKSAMKIVYLCWTIPFPLDSGGKIRSYNLLRYLAEHHEVHLHVPTWRPVDIPQEFRDLFASITIYRFRYVEWKKSHRFRIAKGIPRNITGYYTNESLLEFQKLFCAQAGELIFVDESVVAPYAWPLNQTPSILARQKAEHLFYGDVFRRTPLGIAKIKALIEALLYRSYEHKLWRRFKYGVVVSEKERNLYLDLDSTLNLGVIPNGVDISHFQMTPLPTNSEPTIIFHGSMSFYPNVDAAVWFVREIFPLILEDLPQAKLLIVGQDPADEVKELACSNQIIVTGRVPDMREYLDQAHLVVVPIRIGHGTRLKITEAMAVGRPIVSTPIGAEGLTVESDKHLLLAEDPVDFAACAVKVLTNQSLAEQLVINGRQLVEKEYSWQSIGKKLEQYCKSVIDRESLR